MAPWGLVGRCIGQYETQVVTLQSVDIEVSVRGFVGQVNACLTYHNATDIPLEVEYRMPIDEGAAVYRFEAIVNDRKITAQCMEKKKAEQVYKEAVQSGHTAVLAREDALAPDIFHLALGNLPAGSKAELQLGMVMELKVKTDGAVNFTLPAVLNPRYCPADVTSNMHTMSVAQHGSPETSVVSKAYTFNIKASVQGGHSISRIISHSDALNVSLSDDAMSAEVTQDGGFKPDHDWSMLLYYSNAYKTHIIRETGDRSSTRLMKDDLIMVNLHPEISEQSYSHKNEVIFVVDRSGSMQGEKIQSARATLLLFLKSLPSGCYFNVISFGSTYSCLFPKGSEKYTEQTLQEACVLQERMGADMGGTEILQPLKQIYSTLTRPGYARQILLLSDGQVFNVDQVKQLVSRYAHETRVFAVGIGDGASTALINGLARAGRGRSEMVYQQDKLQLKVMGLVRSMLQESVQEVKVNFEVDPPGGIKLVPKVPPVIFGGQHVILYARVPPSTSVNGITIKGVIGAEAYSTDVQGSDIVTIHDEKMTLHRLAARAQINQWQVDEEEDVAEDMIALSLASGVVSRLTALVGVDQDMTPVAAAPKPEPQLSSTSGLFSTNASVSSFCFGASAPLQHFGASAPLQYQAAPQMCSTGGPFGSQLCSTGGLFGSQPHTIAGLDSTAELLSLQSRSFGGASSGMRQPQYQKLSRSAGPPLPLALRSMPESGGFSFHAPSVNKKKRELTSGADMLSPVKIVKEKEDTLMAIVNLQKFDGSWTPEDAARLTSMSQQRLNETNAAKTEVAWATALVLALLEMEHSSEKDQWALLANKAGMFITSGGDDVKALVASARKVLADK